MSIITSAQQIPKGYSLAECAVSGGNLRSCILDLMKITEGRLCLSIRFYQADFLLPATDGNGQELEQLHLTQLMKGRQSRYSPSLCANYFTYLDGDNLHAVLFDTEKSILEKYKAAEACGVKLVFTEDPAVQQILNHGA